MSSYRSRLPQIRFSAHSKWVYGLLFPWFIPLTGYFLFGMRYISELPVFLIVTSINLSIATLCFFAMDVVVLGITSKYPKLGQTLPRVLWMSAAFVVITTLVILAGFWLYTHFSILNYTLKLQTVKHILLLNLLGNLVSVGVYEGVYSITEWKAGMQEREALQKINLQNQFESLRSQVDPHFLFNSLNSLSSLIITDAARAEQYVQELSSVYRYLLENNKQDITRLKAELDFAASYFHLLKIRFGQAISLEIAVADELLNMQLPPLSLQLLLENAVKHNVARVSRPLQIEIKSTPDGRLMVRNNLQPKTTQQVSHQVGLSNIAAKYRLLGQREIELDDSGGFYTVTIPLISQVNTRQLDTTQ
ncbi:sensor histidine kinase [Cesiribacter sp. SM1]|uniref:sensor histidine kinase n=1 Tax=Cesiribacter sp. SM1 TaxID=2861196 RepID=UPI001CD3B91C|nr:sensor histidine kinase [Cesiribacter sp. SM1]